MSLDVKLAQAVQDGVIPGAVLLAASSSGHVNYANVVGRRSLRVGVEDPLRLDTVFTLASMTKLLTTLCVLQLFERGALGLDADVSQHVPVLARQPILTGFSQDDGSPLLEERRCPITMRHLLTHSSGAGYHFMDTRLKRYVEYTRRGNPAAIVDDLFDLPLLHQPGAGWTYGSGITWAGKVVEKLTGQSLGAYMDSNIFKPLGITRIAFFLRDGPCFPATHVSDMAIRDAATGALAPGPPGLPFLPPLEECFGGEGAYGSLTDYFKVLRSLLLDDEKLLRKETTRLMFEPQLPTQAARDGLRAAFEDPSWAVGDFSGPRELDSAYGGLLVVGDAHPFRMRGHLSWSGAANLYWFIDRGAGVCGLWGTQVLPPADTAVEQLIGAFEKHVYNMATEEDDAEGRSKSLADGTR
ncbi:beta-lactamase family protein [Cladophialophora carrionii]|uniref:Beta-lactamase family protein n=1 Tax=Cladophialophora carrionii TaxID=86049 RepID=A0A1C1C812_9EURO|nr:beta-lactamase family protein [Cladophialophora carrionii]